MDAITDKSSLTFADIGARKKTSRCWSKVCYDSEGLLGGFVRLTKKDIEQIYRRCLPCHCSLSIALLRLHSRDAIRHSRFLRSRGSLEISVAHWADG
jgi:hypothetical protein